MKSPVAGRALVWSVTAPLSEVKNLGVGCHFSQQLELSVDQGEKWADGTHPQVGTGLSRRDHWRPPIINPCLSVPEQPSGPGSSLGERRDRAGSTRIGAGKQRPQGKVQLQTQVERVLGEVILEPAKSSGTHPCFLSMRSPSQTACTLWTQQL